MRQIFRMWLQVQASMVATMSGGVKVCPALRRAAGFLIRQYACPNGSSPRRMRARIESRRAESCDAFMPRVAIFSAGVKASRGKRLSAMERRSSSEENSQDVGMRGWFAFVAVEQAAVFAFIRGIVVKMHPCRERFYWLGRLPHDVYGSRWRDLESQPAMFDNHNQESATPVEER